MNRRTLLRSAIGLTLAPIAGKVASLMPAAPVSTRPFVGGVSLVGEMGPEYVMGPVQILPSAVMFARVTQQLTTIEQRSLRAKGRTWLEA